VAAKSSPRLSGTPFPAISSADLRRHSLPGSNCRQTFLTGAHLQAIHVEARAAQARERKSQTHPGCRRDLIGLHRLILWCDSKQRVIACIVPPRKDQPGFCSESLERRPPSKLAAARDRAERGNKPSRVHFATITDRAPLWSQPAQPPVPRSSDRPFIGSQPP
jgi:hypothetical protein